MARDGYAALDEARREPPDLVVLDLMLPGLDGVAVCGGCGPSAPDRWC